MHNRPIDVRRLAVSLSLVVCTAAAAHAEIKVTGRPKQSDSTTAPNLLRPTEERVSTSSANDSLLQKTTQRSQDSLTSKLLQPADRLNTLSDALFRGTDFGMEDPPVSSVSLTSVQTELVMAPGETRILPVAISRNGAIGHLYFAALYDYGDTLDSADMDWMDQFSCQVNPVCPATGLPFATHVVDVQIQVQPNAQQGTVGTFRLIGHEVDSGAAIHELQLTVLVEGEPQIATDSALISVQSTDPNPFINGSYFIEGQQVAAFLDYNQDGKVAFAGGTSEVVYPAGRYVNPYSDLGWSLVDGAAFDNGANLVVVGMLSSWSSVDRPQFVALYLKLDGQSVTPVSMWAGDLLNEAPLPEGATSQGIVMATTYAAPPVINIDPVVSPASGNAGMIRGTASGNVWSNTASGNLIGTSVIFNFDVPLQYDGND